MKQKTFLIILSILTFVNIISCSFISFSSLCGKNSAEKETGINDALLASVLVEGHNAGSGVIVEKNSMLTIITNEHVIEDGEEITITFFNGEHVKVKEFEASFNGDVAKIKVPAEDILKNTYNELKVAKCNYEKHNIGDKTFVIGNAFNYGFTTTSGIISGTKKAIINNKDYTLIQTDAATNAGNSGGGLFNEKGELIGIITLKTTIEGAEGMSFAINIKDV